MQLGSFQAIFAFIVLAGPAIAIPNLIAERGWHKNKGGDTVTVTQAVAQPAPITLATVAAGQPAATVVATPPMATVAIVEGGDYDTDD